MAEAGTAIERALQLAKPPNIDIAAMEAKLRQYEVMPLPKKSDILGIENAAFNTISKARGSIENEMRKIDAIRALSEQFLTLSYAPLKWRNEEGFPLLVPFSINDPNTVLVTTQSGRRVAFTHTADIGWYTTTVNKKMEDQYQDLRKKLTGPRGGQLYLRYRFEGFLPNDVRDRIRAAMALGLTCFIIAEPETHVLRRVSSIARDPLAVGLDKNDRMWLIADFDVTPVESLMVFTDPETDE